nr:putative reverse transcriptase domain-containing protein [Tanacetum cinerariifolium]
VGERVIEGPEMIEVTNAKVAVAKEKLKEARTRQKSYADKHCRALEFQPGDHVFLKVPPARGVRRFSIKGKLSPCFIGPFEILDRVGSSGPRRFFRYTMFLYSCYLCYVMSLYPFTERYAQSYFFSCFDTADASEGFEQIINFLNASAIQYALTVNPNIYVSCIKQFWSSVLVKKMNDVVQLQALIDRKKVIITEDIVRQALRLDDAESIDCLPNEEIFTELTRMGYEKPSTKLTFYKAFFSAQWKFLIHTILQCMSAKRTAWNEFSSSMASAVICLATGGIIADLDADKDVTLEEVDDAKDAEVEKNVELLLSISKVVTAAATTITAAATPITAATITAAPSVARRRKRVVIRDTEETATPSTIVHSETKAKDKGKGILVEEPKPLKKQAQIKQDEAYARELEAELNKNINWDDVIEQMDYFKGMSYDAIRLIFEKYFNSNAAFLEKSKEKLEKEASRALKRTSESSKKKAAKKQKLDVEVEELKKHLQIVPNDDDDDYTKATPLALKVPVVDYEIHTGNNKPHYKIIRADKTHQLFLSFLSLLRNFNREDLEMLWQIVQDRFVSLKPKNFSDDCLLTTLKAMF